MPFALVQLQQRIQDRLEALNAWLGSEDSAALSDTDRQEAVDYLKQVQEKNVDAVDNTTLEMVQGTLPTLPPALCAPSGRRPPSANRQLPSVDRQLPSVDRQPQTRAGSRHALEGKGPQRVPQKRFDGRLEEVAKAVWAGYCRLQMPLRLPLGVRETVAGHRLGALDGGGGVAPPIPMHPWRVAQWLGTSSAYWVRIRLPPNCPPLPGYTGASLRDEIFFFFC